MELKKNGNLTLCVLFASVVNLSSYAKGNDRKNAIGSSVAGRGRPRPAVHKG